MGSDITLQSADELTTSSIHPGETADERAERLLHLGLDIAIRIRDEDPTGVRATVDAMPVDELRDTFLLVAACVPVDARAADLLSWYFNPRSSATGPRALKPCGTAAAARRHRDRGEPLDDACKDAEREYQRNHKRKARGVVAVTCDGAAGEEAA